MSFRKLAPRLVSSPTESQRRHGRWIRSYRSRFAAGRSGFPSPSDGRSNFRAPTQHEWDVLVTELRDTFDAPGHVTGGGGIFEWRSGNLHAYIEPAMGGYRLRMNTRKGSAVALSMASLVGIGWSALVFIGLSVTGDLAQGFLAPTLVSLVSGGGLASALLRLPGWARARGEQMEQIAHRAQALISPGSEGEEGTV